MIVIRLALLIMDIDDVICKDPRKNYKHQPYMLFPAFLTRHSVKQYFCITILITAEKHSGSEQRNLIWLNA